MIIGHLSYINPHNHERASEQFILGLYPLLKVLCDQSFDHLKHHSGMQPAQGHDAIHKVASIINAPIRRGGLRQRRCTLGSP
jgi:hypothetical protein